MVNKNRIQNRIHFIARIVEKSELKTVLFLLSILIDILKIFRYNGNKKSPFHLEGVNRYWFLFSRASIREIKLVNSSFVAKVSFALLKV